LPFDKHDDSASLSALCSFVSSVKEDYVLISFPEVYYDEAFISSAMELLLNDTELNLKAIFTVPGC